MAFEAFVPLMKPSKGFEELKKLVIDQGICSACGTCAAFCGRLGMDKDEPNQKQECNMELGAIHCSDEGTCYDHCLMTSFSISELEKEIFRITRKDKELGCYKKIVAVRSKNKDILDRAQDGGAVTSLLVSGGVS